MNYLIALCMLNFIGLCVVGWKHFKLKKEFRRSEAFFCASYLKCASYKQTYEAIERIHDYLKVELKVMPKDTKLVKKKG